MCVRPDRNPRPDRERLGLGWSLCGATAATLHRTGHTHTAADAAKALEPVAGRAAEALFTIGLLGASLLAGAVLPLATAYALGEAFGFRKGVNLDFRRAGTFFGLFTVLTIIAPALRSSEAIGRGRIRGTTDVSSTGKALRVACRTSNTATMDGKDRIEFQDVAILAQNDRVVLCRVAGKVVSIAHLRLLPGTAISERGDHGTLVVTRDVAEKLGLVFP